LKYDTNTLTTDGTKFKRSSNHVTPASSESVVVANAFALSPAVEALERQMINDALAKTQGNKSKAAKLLEISERSLWYKISQYQIH